MSVPGAVVTRPYSMAEARADILGAQQTHADTIQAFHALVYHQRHTWSCTHYEGVPVLKLPQDLWTYHQWIHALKPSLIVETGTAKGGSALYFARQMEAWDGKVVTFDLERHEGLPHHSAIRYVTGDSSNDELVRWALARYPLDRVMVVLDSLHTAEHVAKELDVFAPYVSVGQLLVVEDTNTTGPAEAVATWLPTHPEFQPEVLCERHLMTFSPCGWLWRVA